MTSCWGVIYIGGGFILLIFTPTWGRFPYLTNIFQRGWNHQPVILFQSFGTGIMKLNPFWEGESNLIVNVAGHFEDFFSLYKILYVFFPKQVYLWGSILERNKLDTLVGALGLVGRGFGPAGRDRLGWAWGLAVLGALAGLGVVLGVGFGRAGRAGWVGRGVGRAGRAARVGRGVAGRAGWVGHGAGRGVWPGWVVLGVLGALAGLGVVLGVGFGRGVWPCWARWLEVQKYTFKLHKVYSGSTQIYFQSTKVYSGSTQVCFQSTQVYSGSTKVYSGSTKVYCGEKTQKQGCWECYLIQLIYLHCLGSMPVSFWLVTLMAIVS